MKSFKLLVIFLFACCQFAVAQNEELVDRQQEVLQAQSARISAMINADVEKLKELLDEDLTYSHTTGCTETKSGYLETIQSKRIDYLQFSPRDVEVRIYGSTAVLTGLVDVNLGRTDFTIRFLEVQRRVDGQWKLTAWQSVINKVD